VRALPENFVSPVVGFPRLPLRLYVASVQVVLLVVALVGPVQLRFLPPRQLGGVMMRVGVVCELHLLGDLEVQGQNELHAFEGSFLENGLKELPDCLVVFVVGRGALHPAHLEAQGVQRRQARLTVEVDVRSCVQQRVYHKNSIK